MKRPVMKVSPYFQALGEACTPVPCIAVPCQTASSGWTLVAISIVGLAFTATKFFKDLTQ